MAIIIRRVDLRSNHLRTGVGTARMRKQYVDDGLYDNYYIVGSGGAAFAGARYQRRHGFSGIFGGLFRAATPLLKRGAMALGKQITRSGTRVAKDVAAGKKSNKL